VDALLDADGADRLRNGRSPRFRRYRSGWGLSEKDMPTEIAAMEKAIFDAAARMEAIAERLVAKKVRGLQAPRFFHLAARLLRCMGFSDAEPLSASESEALLRVADRRDSGTAILVLLRRESGNGAINERDVRSFREQVSGRGARRGLLITTGDVSKGAMAEAARAPAISLMGGAALAAEMVRCGIGVERRHAVIPVFDETSF